MTPPDGYDTIDPDFVRDFAARWMAAYNAKSLSDILAQCTEDILWEDPGLPEAGRGHEAVRRFLAMTWTAFPDIHFSEPEPVHLALDGSQAIARWRATATMLGPLDPPGLAATRRPVAFDGVDLWRFRAGRLATYRAIYDTGDMARQLGALPAQGTLAERMVVAWQRIQTAAGRRLRLR